MNKIPNRPDPNAAFPNPKIPSLCFIKNVVKNPRIIIGDYTYYDDVDGADRVEAIGCHDVAIKVHTFLLVLDIVLGKNSGSA